MLEKHLGDSYDIVKRFWRDQLDSIGPLYAHSRFVPERLQGRYTELTTIPILPEELPPSRPFGLFFDPHTRIPLPKEGQAESPRYAPLSYIVSEHKRLRPRYMLCFDQCHDRLHMMMRKAEQREAKRESLRAQGIASFYYLSHAPFLFMAANVTDLQRVRRKLISSGVPEDTPNSVRLQAIVS